MSLLLRWLRLACGLAALAAVVWLLAAIRPPAVVGEAQERGIDTTALFWSEVEGFEAYEIALAAQRPTPSRGD
jgi:hypothetical protein